MNLKKPNFWETKNNIFVILLLPFSLIFFLITYLKRKFTIPVKFKIPVICIGNIFIGGTGKTPLSIFIAQELKNLGRKPVIIKKFYENQKDEQMLIEKETGSLITHTQRKKAIKAAEENYDLAILDDGFQDYSIRKDLNILCFNNEQLIGNGFIFPSGPLRENFGRIIEAKIIIINGKKNEEFERKIYKINRTVKIFYSKYEAQNIEKFRGKNTIAIAGIGNPQNFFKILQDNDISLEKTISYPDHYEFSQLEIEKLEQEAKDKNCSIITTEKDFLRIQNLKFENISYCRVKLEIFKKDFFLNEIKNLYV